MSGATSSRLQRLLSGHFITALEKVLDPFFFQLPSRTLLFTFGVPYNAVWFRYEYRSVDAVYFTVGGLSMSLSIFYNTNSISSEKRFKYDVTD